MKITSSTENTGFGWGKGGNVTFAGCDPIWHVSFRVAMWHCKLLYPLMLTSTEIRNSEAFFPQVIPADLEESKSNATKRDVHCISECRERDYNQNTHLITKPVNPAAGRLGSRVVSIGFKLQPWRCRVTVLGKLFTPIVPLFTNQRNW